MPVLGAPSAASRIGRAVDVFDFLRRRVGIAEAGVDGDERFGVNLAAEDD